MLQSIKIPLKFFIGFVQNSLLILLLFFSVSLWEQTDQGSWKTKVQGNLWACEINPVCASLMCSKQSAELLPWEES